MKPAELEISISVDSYDEKTAENDQNWYEAEKRIFSKLSKYQSQLFIAQVIIAHFFLEKPLVECWLKMETKFKKVENVNPSPPVATKMSKSSIIIRFRWNFVWKIFIWILVENSDEI